MTKNLLVFVGIFFFFAVLGYIGARLNALGSLNGWGLTVMSIGGIAFLFAHAKGLLDY